VAEPVVEAEAVADAEAEPVVDVEAVADAEAEPVVDVEAVADAEAEPVVATETPIPAVDVAAADDDTEADWADLFRRLPDPADDEPPADEWSTMAPWLGPDVAPAGPAPQPVPRPATAPPPVPPPAQPAAAWQITAPESDVRPAQWPPLGPVFRPQPAPPQPAPHPSVIARRPSQGGLLARGRATAGGALPMPNGVRPCVNCELPLSATARFCRRCGRPQG
jgi:hypothetical protein